MDYDVSDPTNVGLPTTAGYYYGQAFRNGESWIQLWGNNSPLWDPNFILAHELGHALGLNHTWCSSKSIPCDGDGYADTPNETVPCPTSSTCPNNVMGPFGTDRYYFSPTQIGRMHQWLKNLLSSKIINLNYNSWIETSITQNTTYSGINNASTGLRVTSGNTLKITGTLLMPPYSKIIVEPNARLVLDCGTITGYGGIWKGIILLGQNYVPQDTLTQAKLIMRNNSSIANALDGVRNYEDACNPSSFSGGIIEVSNSSFISNVRDVGLEGYLPVNPLLTMPFFNFHNYQATFTNVLFRKGINYVNPDNYVRDSWIYIDGVQGVTFEGCEFAYENGFNNGLVHAKNAILVVNGGINMLNGGNKFRVIEDAIILRNTQPRYIGSQIHDNDFVWCRKSITNEGAFSWNSITKSRSQFPHRSPDNLIPYGYNMPYDTYIKGNMATHYVNNFVYGNGPGTGLAAAGLIVNNIGEANMIAHYNHFSTLTINTQSIGKNRSNDGMIGLEYHCNKFYSPGDNYIYVLPTNLISPDPNDGIKLNQGSPGQFPAPPQTDELAGNIFNSSTSSMPVHFHNFGVATTLLYHHHDSASAPQVVPFNKNNVNNVDHGVTFNATISCPVPLKIEPEGDTLGEFDYPASQAHIDVPFYDSEADSLEILRETLVDGGNSWQLEAEILYSSNEDNYILYTDLMNESPYLSEGPIQELIERTGFPDIMLRNILLANPHVGREPWVIEQLAIHHPNMPQYMIDDIINGTTTLDGLDYLNASISTARSKQIFAAQVAIKDVVENFDENSFTQVQDILATIPYSNYQYIRVELYQQHGDFTQANQLLSSIPSSLDFQNDDDMMIIHGHYVDWFSFKEDMYTQEVDFCSLGSGEVTELETFADNADMTGAWARSALSTYHNFPVDYPVYIPESGYNKRAETYSFPNVPRPTKSLYPNPATDLVHVNLDLKTSLTDLKYYIYDIKGVPV